MVNVYGLCIAKVTDKLIIESLDVYYNPNDLLKPLVTNVQRGEGDVCVGRGEADGFGSSQVQEYATIKARGSSGY